MENMVDRPCINGSNFKELSDSEQEALISPFSRSKIKTAVWECGCNKAPDPNGFNIKFIKHFWNILEKDFVEMVNHFYVEESLDQSLCSSFIALVPKVNGPTKLEEFRPINLVGVAVKIVSKILANRMKVVMNSIISENQTAFIKKRYILDGPLMVNEYLSWMRKKKKQGMIFKIDFEKAYDNISWKFLDSIMANMKFPDKWRK
ncbi:putative RNA-directed DNA polymerase [Helianthus annuus]|uniref:RNA-directed DNA polymerase n=1 Tax=Helianthus annuus TaxID=4232 RepID=A0A9K3J1X7_HELAN|nr:putative RNA-directed DNA polymerase [Helianthus annuus]KAJ0920501.1 putative RNA-directed DNA polymerase [Helianthus annuus]KAJ0924124.1 putative RNA-directed DNA polymerase [Helianthus annuus]